MPKTIKVEFTLKHMSEDEDFNLSEEAVEKILEASYPIILDDWQKQNDY